jgi:uncharacterized protein (DUF1015 family)
MIEHGWLARDETPAFYVYRLSVGEHSQTGITGAASVDDYLAGRVKRHEHTRPDKEDDRLRMNDSLSAHPGPVLMTYRAVPELDAVVDAVQGQEPAARFTKEDGVEHTLWVVDAPDRRAEIEDLFRKVSATYVADGHHRAAAAARVSTLRRRALERPTGEEPCHYFLAVHFPANQLRILDYNRVVRDLRGMTPEALVERLHAAGFDVTADHTDRRPPRRGTFGMYLAGCWSLVSARPEIVPRGDLPGGLDVSVLSDAALSPILGIGDPRTDERIGFIGGSRGMEHLERLVDSGDWAVAFALYPTSLDEIMRVADAGEVMPPKSTWFDPKLRSGLIVQSIDGDKL